MWMTIRKELRTGFGFLACMTVLLGLAYPLAVTALGQAFFPWQASGSPLTREGRVVGCALIGQTFTTPGYFWGRPSATAPMAYNAMASAGSNLGPTNPALAAAVAARISALREVDPDQAAPVPVDLVTAAGSGLDPHISPAAAFYQIARVAKARGLPEETVRALVERHIEGRQFGVLGEPRVNVLALNLALDAAAGKSDTTKAVTP
ncbi:MAG: potassium-transporting ATPase subunit KdpC [Desulfovibrionaceae bacterium]